MYLSATVTKRYQCTQEDESKVVENTLQNAPSCLKHSQYNRQAAEEESYPGEIELQNERRNENWRFTSFLKLVKVLVNY